MSRYTHVWEHTHTHFHLYFQYFHLLYICIFWTWVHSITFTTSPIYRFNSSPFRLSVFVTAFSKCEKPGSCDRSTQNWLDNSPLGHLAPIILPLGSKKLSEVTLWDYFQVYEEWDSNSAGKRAGSPSSEGTFSGMLGVSCGRGHVALTTFTPFLEASPPRWHWSFLSSYKVKSSGPWAYLNSG